MARSILDRFSEKYVTVPEAGCWIWVAAWQPTTGYGRMGTVGKYVEYAHRISWQLFVGEVPSRLEVCHKCDTRLCVNPAHLFVGTRSGNMKDCSAKGRLVMPRENWHSSETHQVAKLTNAQVLLTRAGGRTDTDFAAEYGVRPGTIGAARRGETFKDVS